MTAAGARLEHFSGSKYGHDLYERVILNCRARSCLISSSFPSCPPRKPPAYHGSIVSPQCMRTEDPENRGMRGSCVYARRVRHVITSLACISQREGSCLADREQALSKGWQLLRKHP